ncbi:MAG: helix-turn-helix transcriptional regulator [Acidimicrobiia bacterium]
MSHKEEDIRTWRLLQRMTVEQLADRAGVNFKTLLSLEKGQGTNLESLLRITRALGLLDQISGALDPHDSDVGRLRADEGLAQRIRPSKKDRN